MSAVAHFGLSCKLVPAMHAWLCPVGHGTFAYLTVVAQHGRLVMRVIGLIA